MKEQKLVLNRETVRSLTDEELDDVNAASGATCVSICCCNTSQPVPTHQNPCNTVAP